MKFLLDDPSRMPWLATYRAITELSDVRCKAFFTRIADINLRRCLILAVCFAIYEPISLFILQKNNDLYITNYYYVPTFVLIAVSYLYILVYILIRSQKSLMLKKVLYSAFYFLVTAGISGMIYGDFFNEIKILETRQYLLNYVVILAIIIVIPLINKIYSIILIMIPLLTVTTCNYMKFNSISIEPVIMALFSMVVAFSFGQSIMMGIINELHAMDARDVMAKQLDQQIDHYRQLEHAHMELRAYKHDIFNHFIAIETLISDNNPVGAIEYMNSITESMKSANVTSYTNHQILDAILTSKAASAKQYGIDFKADIRVPANLDIDSVDLSIIMGNFLDNALEACKKSYKQERFIKVSMGCKNDIVFGKIVNTSTENINSLANNFRTTKSDAVNHGFGLNNARRSIEKYNGFMTTEQKDEEFITTFHMNLAGLN